MVSRLVNKRDGEKGTGIRSEPSGIAQKRWIGQLVACEL